MKGLISLDDEARWRPREPAFAETLAQILISACILDNSQCQRRNLKLQFKKKSLSICYFCRTPGFPNSPLLNLVPQVEDLCTLTGTVSE